jgi:hypothetical protein
MKASERGRWGRFSRNEGDGSEEERRRVLSLMTITGTYYYVSMSLGCVLAFRFPRQTGLDRGFFYRGLESYVPGYEWVQGCLMSPNPDRMKRDIGVYPTTFSRLYDEIEPYLQHLQQRDVTLEEMLATFLMILISGGGFRNTCRQLQRSKSTVSESFWTIAKIFISHVYPKFVKMSDPHATPHSIILNDPRYQFFGNCIGAGDGTYIKCHVCQCDMSRMRCRKGFTAQNVFAIADFNMTFLFAQPGGDGSAPDSVILGLIEDGKLFHLFPQQVYYYYYYSNYNNNYYYII